MFTRIVVAIMIRTMVLAMMMITTIMVAMMMKAQSSHGRVNNCSKWPPSSSYPTGAASCFHDDRDDYDDHRQDQDQLHLRPSFCGLPKHFHGDALGCSNVAEAASGRPFLNQTFEVLTVFCHSRHRHLVSRVMTRGWSDLPEAHITPKCW